MHRTVSHCLTRIALAAALPQAALAVPSAPTLLWHEAFGPGEDWRANWVSCALPYENRLEQCAATQAGPGEQVYWNPRLVGGGRDPIVQRPVDGPEGGGIALVARRMSDGEHALLATAITLQDPIAPGPRAALAGAGWTSGWLQSRQSFPVGTTIAARLLPAAGASSWGGLWLINDPAHRHWPPEIDVAEVTNEPDGRMRVRQVIHYRDAAGALQSGGCGFVLMPRGWITASITRKADALTFAINGVETCTVAAPPGFGDPMTVILSQQVGGLARHTDAATADMALAVRWIRVTRP